jgi:hypothetical protein
VSTVADSGSAYARALHGCWELVRREDRTESGEVRIDPGLGPAPVGLLVYHPSGRFSAQFMRRDRTQSDPAGADTGRSGRNNTRAVGGYDSYFGRYTVDEATHTVTQTLEGALAPDNVGLVVTRQMEVEGDLLTLRLPTTTTNGEPIVRTLQWRRCSDA